MGYYEDWFEDKKYELQKMFIERFSKEELVEYLYKWYCDEFIEDNEQGFEDFCKEVFCNDLNN